jgi:signal transduction histidine kinase
MVTVILTVVLMFLNVWVTARLMFISYHDLVLTTALLIFAGCTAIAFGFFIATTITDSIGELVRTTQKLAQGDLSARLEVRGNDELARLAETINWMASNLQEIDEQKRSIEQTRRNLIAWVSHDLRTPLASMRVMIEAMLDGVVTDDETRSRYLRNTHAEIAHINGLIDDLFELAQLDVGRLQMEFQQASLADLISDTLGSMNAQAVSREVILDGYVEPEIDPVEFAPDKIQRVLYNLIDNAVEHTPSGGRVTLRAYRVSTDVRVDVRNTGSHIDREDLPHIFTSFYRGEQSRARGDHSKRGAGLGLAISRGLVEAHGGKIWLDNAGDQAIVFSFTLPRSQAQSAHKTQPSMRALNRT